MKKALILMLLSLTAIVGLSLDRAAAYPGGLLDGKPGWRNYDGATITALTDGNLNNTANIQYGTGNYIRWYLTGGPYNITRAQWSKNSGQASISIRAYNASGVEIGRYNVGGQAEHNARSQNVNWRGATQIRIYNTASGFSAVVKEFDVFGSAGPPLPPTGLKATPSAGQALLTWDAVPNVTGYYIYRNNTKITLSPITGTSYTAMGLADNTVYTWHVSATNGEESVLSAAVTSIYDTIPPPPVTGLKAEPGEEIVKLTWNALSNVPDLSGYRVYKDGELLTASPITTASYTVTGLVNKQSHEFVVRAVDQSGNESPPSSITAAAADLTPPAPPANLTATPDDKRVTLTWEQGIEPDLAGYRIYNDAGHLQTVGKTTTSLNVTGLDNGKSYSFRVLAYDEDSNASAPATASAVPNDITPPAAPANLTATAGNKLVNLMWTLGAEPDLRGYYVYVDGVRLSGQPTKDIYRTVTGLNNGQAYNIEVTAVDQSGNESPRSAVTATPDVSADSTPPATPIDFTATGNKRTITATWTANAEPDLVGYFVYLDGQRVTYAPITANALNIPNLTLGQTYQVAVSAIDNSGNESPRSAPVSVYIDEVPAPTNLKATDSHEPGAAGIHLTWTETDPPPDRYAIYRNGIKLTEVAAPPYLDNSVELGNGYIYEVSALRDDIESDKALIKVRFSDKDINLGGVPGLVALFDVIETAFSYLSRFWPYVLLVLGIIFAPAILNLPFALFRLFQGKNQAVVPRGKGRGRGRGGNGAKSGGQSSRSNGGNATDRRYEQLLAEGRRDEAKQLIDRTVEMGKRHARETRELREYEERQGRVYKEARKDLFQRQREERQAFNREVGAQARAERAARNPTASRPQRGSRGGRGTRNGRR